MQFEETVHGYPEAVAVVHLLVRLEILSPQVKSGPQRGSRLWLRPQAALWNLQRPDMGVHVAERDIQQRDDAITAGSGKWQSDQRQQHAHQTQLALNLLKLK